MKRDDKGINRRAFPKFLLWVLLGGVLGFFAGLAGGIASDLHLADSVEAWLTGVLQAAAPWGIPVTSGVLLAICLGFYLSAKRLYMAWDGEDETLPDQVDRKLNYTLLCSSLATILDFFFIAVGVLYTDSGRMALLIVGEMLVSVALVVLVQQKIVDLVRRMNPEKQVSVYDITEELVKTSPIGANGVMNHPYLLAGGERAPAPVATPVMPPPAAKQRPKRRSRKKYYDDW